MLKQLIFVIALIPIVCPGAANAEEKNTALDLNVEDLLNVQVTSVAKKAQALNDAPAAIFVISHEDIKRSGVTSIPEALRMAPGMDVSRIDANKWAVTSRGFNGRFANKLQVLIDGRSAYTRTFAGVYWENQDVMLEDVERIEVIRGPGATLWGANAVNGVINIITKTAADTQGALLNAGGGTEERGFGSFRYGAKLGENTHARAYIKGFDRDSNTHLTGKDANDSWTKVQGGFRMDSQLSQQDVVTLQGDLYQNNINQSSYFLSSTPPYQLVGNENNDSYGGNILGRWQHTTSVDSEYSLQLYYDTYSRRETLYDDKRDTLDVDFQHRFDLLNWHDIVWGLSYRFGHDNLSGNTLANGSKGAVVQPASVNDQVFSGFIQDELTLIDNQLWLTVGSKFEHNDYSGFEGQPSARMMWAPHHQHRLWTGVSRAVRTPSRGEQTNTTTAKFFPPNTIFPSPLPILGQIEGTRAFQSEEVLTYEAGYRVALSKSVSFDITGFYSDYSDLRATANGRPSLKGNALILPMTLNNAGSADTFGVEVVSVWQMLDWWRWDFNYSWLESEFAGQGPQSATPATSPEHRVSLRAGLSVLPTLDVDLWGRYISTQYTTGSLGNFNPNGYFNLDLRVAWRPLSNLELSLVGQNLVADKHLEYVQENQTFPTALDRGFYGKLSWSF